MDQFDVSVPCLSRVPDGWVGIAFIGCPLFWELMVAQLFESVVNLDLYTFDNDGESWIGPLDVEAFVLAICKLADLNLDLYNLRSSVRVVHPTLHALSCRGAYRPISSATQPPCNCCVGVSLARALAGDMQRAVELC
jgi:hypothetical protein